jgi:pimeloyl-ACP methyl ester carboxylesterase
METVAHAARQRLLQGLPVSEHRYDLAGVSTSVLEGGEGPPVVLLHGPGEFGAKWLRVIPDLVRTNRVVAPDLPGHGESDLPAEPLDPGHVLAWLDELLARTCGSSATIVGETVGGAIAARYAAAGPSRVGRLVLVDALGLAGFSPAPEFGAALAAFVAKPSGPTFDRLWERCVFDLGRLREDLGDAWEACRAYGLDLAQSPGVQAAQHALLEGFGFPAIPPEELARIAVPTTLIWGRHDLATPLAVAEAASARYAWPLRILEDAADNPGMEQPETFLQALRWA